MPIIIENLKFVYSPKTPFEKTALENINLTVNDGDYLGVIGHTGSGKSTLIQHFNGLIKLQSGKIDVDGIDLSKKYDYKKLRTKVGMVFQYPEYQLFDETVAKDVGFGPRNVGLKGEELDRTVKEAIESVGLDYLDIKDRSPFEISGGQKRRVALAGVIAMRPSILVLDEPTAGLDPKGKKEILELIAALKKSQNLTVVLISHNMDEIAENCTRVAVLDKGRIVYDLPPVELFSKSAELKKIGLDVPVSVKIKDGLNERGFFIDSGVYKKEDLIGGIKNVLIKKRALDSGASSENINKEDNAL